MPVSRMLREVGSMEIAEWICELELRAKEQKEAMEKARNQPAPVMG